MNHCAVGINAVQLPWLVRSNDNTSLVWLMQPQLNISGALLDQAIVSEEQLHALVGVVLAKRGVHDVLEPQLLGLELAPLLRHRHRVRE